MDDQVDYVSGKTTADEFMLGCDLELNKGSQSRNHRWMYDGSSLARLVTEAGFRDAKVLAAGETTIPDPGALNLRERERESCYVETRK